MCSLTQRTFLPLEDRPHALAPVGSSLSRQLEVDIQEVLPSMTVL